MCTCLGYQEKGSDALGLNERKRTEQQTYNVTCRLHPALLRLLITTDSDSNGEPEFALSHPSFFCRHYFIMATRKGTKTATLNTGVYHPPLPVFVFLSWCEVWGAAPGRGGLTVSLGQRDLRWSWIHSPGSVTILHPGWVKVW